MTAIEPAGQGQTPAHGAPTPTQGAWITCPDPRPAAAVRLLCIPYAGVGPSIFRAWSRAMPVEVEVRLAQLPGREGRFREPAATRLEPIVAGLAAACAPLLGKPLAIFGYSLGALIGFELARALRRDHGIEPAYLAVAARHAPHLAEHFPPLHLLPDADLVVELRKRYDGIPETILTDPDLLAMFLPILRADVAVMASYDYAPEPPLTMPITAFGGRDDREVDGASLNAWADQTTGAFRAHILPGGHFFLQAEAAAVIAAVAADLGDLGGREALAPGLGSTRPAAYP